MGLAITWLGHASFQITVDDRTIYVDPYEGDYSVPADLILVTHSHHDHCDPPKIAQIQKPNTVIIAPKDCATKITGKTISLIPGETISIDNLTVQAVEAYNYKRFRSPNNPFHPKGFGVGYIFTNGKHTLYHAGDTDFIPEMRKVGTITVGLLPSGGTYTMDNDEAADAALALNPEFVVPMHRWDTDANEFKKKVESRSQIKVLMMKPNETVTLNE